MNRFVTSACALSLIQQLAVAQSAAAQNAALASQSSVTQTVTATQTPLPLASGEMASVSSSPGPTTESARAGIAPSVSKDAVSNTAHVMDPHVGAGQNIALMVVGGAALITGLLISGGAGTAIAIGGAAVGLVGLYGYIK